MAGRSDSRHALVSTDREGNAAAGRDRACEIARRVCGDGAIGGRGMQMMRLWYRISNAKWIDRLYGSQRFEREFGSNFMRSGRAKLYAKRLASRVTSTERK